jgi:hypothetical protein
MHKLQGGTAGGGGGGRQAGRQAAGAATHVGVVLLESIGAAANRGFMVSLVCDEMLLKVGMYFMCPKCIHSKFQQGCLRSPPRSVSNGSHVIS